VLSGTVFGGFCMAIHRFPPDSDRAQRIVASRLEKLKNSVAERRTIRKEMEDRREELLSLRDQGIGIVDMAVAYQDILEGLGWPRPSLSYVIKLVSDITAKGLRSGREQTRSADETPIGTLIPVTRGVIGGIETGTVNALDLHAFLDVGKRFATWITDRIDQFGFLENVDFEVSPETGKNPQGGRPSKE
jgi:hypothetical protein